MGEYIDTLSEIYQERERYLLNIDELLAEIKTSEQLLVCNNNCRKFFEMGDIKYGTIYHNL